MNNEPKNSNLTPDSVREVVIKQGRHNLSMPSQKLGPRRRRDYKNTDALHAIYKRPNRLAQGILVAVLAVVVFVGSALGFFYNDLRNRVSNANLSVEQYIERSDGPREPVDDYSGRALNILILGSDTRAGEANARYGDADDTSMRSDVTIIAHISADRSRVQLVSIPRDTWVEIPSCKLKNGDSTYAQQGQFNWAMSVGSANDEDNLDAGIACVWKTAEKLTGLTIDEYVMFDFAGFESMIDALGGVRMCFQEDLYDPPSELDIKAGCHTLNGHDALAYARARKFVGNGSDISRIGRQQELMGRIFHTAQSKNMLTDFPKLYNFLSETLKSIKTSSSLAKVNTSMGLAYSLADLPSDGLQFVTMPLAEAPWDPNRVIPIDQADELWEAMKNDQPVPAGIQITDSRGNVIVVEDTPTETDANGNPVSEEATSADGGEPSNG